MDRSRVLRYLELNKLGGVVVGGLGWESSGGVDRRPERRRDVGFEEERRWKVEGLGVGEDRSGR